MKIVKEHINEKFSEESDPIADMNIGLKHKLKKYSLAYLVDNDKLNKFEKVEKNIIKEYFGDEELYELGRFYYNEEELIKKFNLLISKIITKNNLIKSKEIININDKKYNLDYNLHKTKFGKILIIKYRYQQNLYIGNIFSNLETAAKLYFII